MEEYFHHTMTVEYSFQSVFLKGAGLCYTQACLTSKTFNIDLITVLNESNNIVTLKAGFQIIEVTFFRPSITPCCVISLT